MAFDWQSYVNNYSDLGAAGIDTQEEALQHWNTFGQNEGRQFATTPASSYIEPLPYLETGGGMPPLGTITGVAEPYQETIRYGDPNIGYGNLTGGQYDRFKALDPQSAYNLARTEYGMSADQIANLWNTQNPNQQIRSQDLSQFDPGLGNYLTNNNLGYATYNNGQGVGKTLPTGSNSLYGNISTYEESRNPRTLGAPATYTGRSPTPSGNNPGGYLTMDQLQAWWNQQQNNNTTGAVNTLATLFPRQSWGNYQTSGRGSRYFDPNSGKYTGLGNITQQNSL